MGLAVCASYTLKPVCLPLLNTRARRPDLSNSSHWTSLPGRRRTPRCGGNNSHTRACPPRVPTASSRPSLLLQATVNTVLSSGLKDAWDNTERRGISRARRRPSRQSCRRAPIRRKARRARKSYNAWLCARKSGGCDRCFGGKLLLGDAVEFGIYDIERLLLSPALAAFGTEASRRRVTSLIATPV